MKIATGTVTHGAIVVEGHPFFEGEKGPFRVSPEQKGMLLESMAQADRGEFVDADDLFAEFDESN